MISVTVKGDFKKTSDFLKGIKEQRQYKVLERYAQQGVEALEEATPKRTGLTSKSWGYEIKQTNQKITITWTNTNFNDGVPIALVIQYGHGLPNGGYVKGVDYINPAMRPIFDKMAEEVWKEVITS